MLPSGIVLTSASSYLKCEANRQGRALPVYSRRLVIAEPGAIRIETVPLPPLENDEVLIRTTKTLISPGTERALLLNLPGLNVQYPKEIGYSHVGVITEIASDVTRLQVGDRVASRSRHASHVIALAELCHKLDASLTDEHAAFFQLLAIALQAVRKTRLEVGEATAVLGAGLVGLLALQVARVAGALPTIAIDMNEGRLKRARQLGADHTTIAEQAIETIKESDDLAEGIPVVIEATGNPAALETACQIASSGARIALLGSSRGATESFDFYKNAHKRGLTLIGAHISATYRNASAPGWWTQNEEQRTALRLIEHGRVEVEPLLTHRFKSSEIQAAYDLLALWNLDTLGIIIDWT